MKILTYTGGPFQTNAYLLVSQDHCLAIDAPEGLAAFLQTHALKPTHLLLTHQHLDHVGSAAALQAQGTQILAHSHYSTDLILEKWSQAAGLPLAIPPFAVDQILTPSQPLTLGPFTFQISHTPGHSPDSLTFHLPEKNILFAGDTLFHQSIGRTDLPGGNHQQLLDSIVKKLYPLPDETTVFPGHGPETTIGLEKKSNPFCPAPRSTNS